MALEALFMSEYIPVPAITPAYVFDVDAFQQRIRRIAKALPGIPLTFSIKANPFLIGSIPGEIQHLEVCSPGELSLCERFAAKGEADLGSVIFSGVNKTRENVQQALADKVGIFTAESRKHLCLIDEETGKNDPAAKVPVILRVSSGNQFGMDPEEVRALIADRGQYEHASIMGLHFYSGTQKKKASQIREELEMLDAFIDGLKKDFGFDCCLMEYGPGMAVDYFGQDPESTDMALLGEVAPMLLSFAEKHPLGVEMGRYMAASCGHYFTKVDDIKTTQDVNYAILDGGIHHLKYHGQTMSMQVPPIRVIQGKDGAMTTAGPQTWCLCGSLCTTADVFVRKVELRGLTEGTILDFGRCGAYSVTEAPALFLSRPMPAIYLYKDELHLVRDQIQACDLNQGIL